MKTNKKTASFYTLGCRVNQYETRAISEEFLNAGFEIKEFKEIVDICVINTCAVTAESERKSAQIIRRASKTADIVMVVGCFSEYKPEYARKITNVKYIGGAKAKSGLVKKAIELLGEEMQKIAEQHGIGHFPDSKVRAFIKIEDGCDGKCSYCIIPKLRGAVVLRQYDEIIEEAKRLAQSGCREIALTGIEISAHHGLNDIIKGISRLGGIDRIRLGSLDPRTLDDEFIETIRDKKFMPHLHISLQSANNRVLGLMKRPYQKELVEERLNAVLDAIPEILVSVDIISSFPSETKAELEETLDFLRKFPISHVHAFPYSPRAGTVAAEMEEGITNIEKKRRHKYLLNESQKICNNTLKTLVGTEQEVLVESCKDGYNIGCTKGFVEVSFKSEKDLYNQIIKVRVDEIIGGKLLGHIVN